MQWKEKTNGANLVAVGRLGRTGRNGGKHVLSLSLSLRNGRRAHLSLVCCDANGPVAEHRILLQPVSRRRQRHAIDTAHRLELRETIRAVG